ncbi:hypothetical protein BS17DRAFT_764057 [Gyrodon lividus]|nr:hypothetical protein BS17DRAFT_764057 [Gyrodon lividus]
MGNRKHSEKQWISSLASWRATKKEVEAGAPENMVAIIGPTCLLPGSAGMSISQKFCVEVKDIVTDEDREGIAGIHWRDPPHCNVVTKELQFSSLGSSPTDYEFGLLSFYISQCLWCFTNTTPITTSDSCHINAHQSVDSANIAAGMGGTLVAAPSIEEAQKALVDLHQLLKPRCADGIGYTNPRLNHVLLKCLEQMHEFLWLYTDIFSDGTPHAANPVGGHWSQAADRAAQNTGKTHEDYLSQYLQNWSKAYIKNHKALPLCMKF